MFKEDEWLNVFQIWRKYGEKTPFAVRRWSWHPESCFIVTNIEVKKFPYGDAYGYFHSWREGKINIDLLKLEKEGKYEKLNGAGCYQWEYVTLIFKMDFEEVKEC